MFLQVATLLLPSGKREFTMRYLFKFSINSVDKIICMLMYYQRDCTEPLGRRPRRQPWL